MEVAVIGLQHLGTTVAGCLAKVGYKVTGFGIPKEDISDPKSTKLFKRMIKKRKLKISQDFKQLNHFAYIIISHDTPFNKNYKADLTPIFEAVKQIKKYAVACTVIVMSQVPVGTCRQINKMLPIQASIFYNPENLRVGFGIQTYLNADRQIIGLAKMHPFLELRMKDFYHFYKKPLLFMSLESAEMVKHGINTFLATSITFANQLADYCSQVKANYEDVEKGLRSDKRIGQKAYIHPGSPSRHLKRDLRYLAKVKLVKFIGESNDL